MAVIFENFLKSCHIYFLDTLGVENFDEIALSLTVKEIEAILCFRTFLKNLKIQNGRHFCKFFQKLVQCIPQIPWGSKISTKSLYLQRLRRQKQFCVFPFFRKNQKFKTAAINEKIFKSGCSGFLRYPGVENFDEIALSPMVKEIEAILCFHTFSKNSKK